MSVQITITGLATVCDKDEKRITAIKTLRSLNGVTYDDDVCSNYFDFGGALDEANVTGGRVGLAFNPAKRRLEVVCTYEASRKLKTDERKLLLTETIAQLSDGIGEGCFDSIPGHPGITVDVCPAPSPTAFRVEQHASRSTATRATATRAVPTASRAKRQSSLWAAAKEGHVDGILAALDAGTKVNQASKGFTALHLAVIYGHVDAVRTLLERGADTRRRDSEGFTALHSCIMSSQLRGQKRLHILELLLDAGAAVNANAKYAGKPLAIAKYYRRSQSIRDALIARGATE